MCGIIAYVGGRDVPQTLLRGLRSLEYRGHDSAGMAVLGGGGGIELIKRKGNLDAIAPHVGSLRQGSEMGIAHTRWATHGQPSEENAHPHLDCGGEIAVVHNGIIENFRELRARLEERGHRFLSQTDSEVVAHLVEDYYDGDLLEATRRALRDLEGAYALVLMSAREPGVLVGARKESPLVMGIGDGENFLASATSALLESTRRAVALQSGELARITRDDWAVLDARGSKVEREPYEVTSDMATVEKGGYADFMLKEIFEQPQAWTDTLRGRLPKSGPLRIEELEGASLDLKAVTRIIFVSCGTSYHASLIGRHIIESWLRMPVEVEIASEFCHRETCLDGSCLVVAMSQSGETADTMRAMRCAAERGSPTLAVVNVVGSMMARESDGVLYTHAGPEIGAAATKTFLTQLAAVYLLGLHLGQERGLLGEDFVRRTFAELEALAGVAEQALQDLEAVERCAERYCRCEDFYFLGRNINHPMAMEAALKLKEISYIHAEGYPAGEMKHGPIALLHPGFPVVVLAPRDAVYGKVRTNIEEVRARQAPVIALASEGDAELAACCDETIFVPEVKPQYGPVVLAPPLQLLAYHIAKLRGCDVDQPRNLAKTVTVE